MPKKTRLAAVLLISALAGGTVQAQISDDVVKLGVTNDQASIYSAAGGFGSVVAARMAAEDFGGSVLGKKIEIVFADNQNKPDIGVGIVRRWIDNEHVDAIVDGGSSAVGMAIQPVTRDANKIFLISGSGTHALTNQNCSATGFQWSWDTYGVAAGTATELMKQKLDTWFFITADYTFGHLLEAQATEIVNKMGGKVVGSVRVPFNTADFSSFLLQAQTSGAKVIALATAGGDTTNAHQAGARIRPRQDGAEGRRTVHEHHGRGCARARSRAGADHHHAVLLGSHRGEPRFLQTLLRDAQEDADVPDRGRILGGDALSQGREGGRHRRHRQGRCARCARRRSTIR